MRVDYEIEQIDRDELDTSTARFGRSRVAHRITVTVDGEIYARDYNSTRSYCEKVMAKIQAVLKGKGKSKVQWALGRWIQIGKIN